MSVNARVGHSTTRPTGNTRSGHSTPNGSGAQASVFALQRNAGNGAVSQLLESHHTNPSSGPDVVPPIVREVLGCTRGQPLDTVTRTFMESTFGHDFRAVRLHTEPKAAESAGVVGASAYTVKNDIVFGEGQPSPKTSAARPLLAHELAHVVQQSRGGSVPRVSLSALHEQDADAAATAVALGRPRVRISCSTGVGLARAPRPEEQIRGDLARENQALQQALEVANQGIQELGGTAVEPRGMPRTPGRRGPAIPRPFTPRKRPVKEELRGIIQERSGDIPGDAGARRERVASAERILTEIENIENRLNALEDELRAARRSSAPPSETHFTKSAPKTESSRLPTVTDPSEATPPATKSTSSGTAVVPSPEATTIPPAPSGAAKTFIRPGEARALVEDIARAAASERRWVYFGRVLGASLALLDALGQLQQADELGDVADKVLSGKPVFFEKLRREVDSFNMSAGNMRESIEEFHEALADTDRLLTDLVHGGDMHAVFAAVNALTAAITQLNEARRSAIKGIWYAYESIRALDKRIEYANRVMGSSTFVGLASAAYQEGRVATAVIARQELEGLRGTFESARGSLRTVRDDAAHDIEHLRGWQRVLVSEFSRLKQGKQ